MMGFCNCEHVRHFPVGAPYDLPQWRDIPRNGHAYTQAHAGTTDTIVGPVCDACAITCMARAEFDREAYARNHGLTLAQLAEFEETYGVDAEELETKRLQDDAEFKSLPPWERTPDTYRQA